MVRKYCTKKLENKLINQNKHHGGINYKSESASKKFSAKDDATYLCTSESTIRRFARERKLHYYKVCNRYRFNEQDLKNFIKYNTVESVKFNGELKKWEERLPKESKKVKFKFSLSFIKKNIIYFFKSLSNKNYGFIYETKLSKKDFISK